ncbi:MAG: efflux RND transporter periplasmic adaptor subunit, partial [Armatimonadetes bacterium]|nr:efflux RND transporter periplasmic adaptor subunit [Armatimonadota bacterium]
SARAAATARGPVQVPVRAPLAGLVTELDASVGEAVGAEANLMTVVDLSEVYVEADIPERDLVRIEQGQMVRARMRAYPDEVFVGAVVSISGELDPQTRAAHVRARLANPRWRLRPGMFAAVGFVTNRAVGALTVPAEAVQEVEGQQVVFVQRSPEQYELRPVTLGASAENRVEVVSGLKPGEVVVSTGSYLLKSQRLKGELGHGHAH